MTATRRQAWVHSRKERKLRIRGPAFTLIELLVVVAIIGLLVSILVPSLSSARALAKLRVCSNNLRNLGHGIVLYATMHRDEIPNGPPGNGLFGLPFSDMATSQIWLGVDPMIPAAGPRRAYVGAGLLLKASCATTEFFFCPDDQTEDESEEQPKIGTDANAYCSYLYRHLDALPPGTRRARLGDLGSNLCQWPGGKTIKVPVQALALDVSTYGQGEMQHLNHGGLKVNVLYQDTSVRDHENVTVSRTGFAPRTDPTELPDDRIFSLYMERAFGPGNYLEKRMNDILVRADFSFQNNPAAAPQAP